MYGGVICSIALVGSVLLGAVIALLYGTRVPSPLACVTPQCVAARDYLSGLLNTSRDACSDFYGYVCSSWIVHGQDDGGSFRADSIATTLVKINNHLWRREDADDDPTDLRLMRRVYQKCHRYTADARDERSFKGTLESARKQLNWAPIRGCRVYRDLVALLVRTSLLLGFHTVVAIQLLSEDTHVLLRLSCGQSLLRKLTTTGEQWNLEATLRIVNYDAGELSKILAIDESVHGHLERRCAGNAGQHDVTKTLDEILDDLVPGVNATEWVSAVDEVLADSGYNRSHLFDVGLASGADGFRVAFHEVTASDGGVETAAMYLASHLDAEILSMELSRNRLPMNPVETAQFCLALARKPVSFSWPRLLARILELRGSKEVLVTMFEYLREAASKTTVFTWLAKVMPRVAEKRIQKVDLAVVSEDMAPKSARTARATDAAPLTADFEQRNATFVELFVQAMAFVHGRLVRNPPTQQEFIVSKLEQLDELAYSEETSSVVVPTLYQRVPHFYAVDVPPYFNYATVGALMATRISEAVGPALTAAKETKGPGRPVQDVWWTRAAMRQYNVTAQCLERLHGRLGLRHKANGGSTAAVKRRDMVLRAQGLRLAYDALVESFGIASASKEFRNLWPEAQAIFFARFCLLSCDADHQSPKPVLSSRANCLLPLHNMPEFGTVFDCGSREDFVAEQCLA
ncbi:uncharacterized protein LOC119463805 [Dermacentor silvarum]|uniref:uncharacterized protein LOC119463805 n=1 Tax=Dermacentor silvarum TaxID=543639 RepID=UPI002101CA2A|nr:uncharacterized protein LOC119463805 [Dermacentor silvarum]